MPAVRRQEAVEQLAKVIEELKPSILAEVNEELFPEGNSSFGASGHELAEYVRKQLLDEEIVDLWNVVFPAHQNVWYDEESGEIHYNEELAGFPE